MLRYDVRFWDKVNRKMIYGAGISPTQQPIVQREDKSLEELIGEFVPMLNTAQKAVNGVIWEGDIIECDVPAFQMEGMPTSFVKARGVMQYNTKQGCFTVNINSNPQLAGATFTVVNSRVIGDIFSNPDLLKVNPNENAQETHNKGSQGQSESAVERP